MKPFKYRSLIALLSPPLLDKAPNFVAVDSAIPAIDEIEFVTLLKLISYYPFLTSSGVGHSLRLSFIFV